MTEVNLENQKLLSVCIIGKPNAGKSTLLNRIIGQKISIVTPKAQTTRSMITGIVTIEDVQLILFDTPGIFEAKKKLERAMVKCAWSSLSSADIIVLILDSSSNMDKTTVSIIERLKTINKKVVFLLNKIDLKSRAYMGNLNFLVENFSSSTIFNISAITGKGVKDFLEFLENNAQVTPWLYETDDITNLPIRFLAAEITREQLFLNLHQELPYSLTVENESWQVKEDGSVKVNQVIIVSKDSHKNMIIGKKGEKLREIGIKARLNIEELAGVKVHLFLFVKVRKTWENEVGYYQTLGLKL